MLSAFSFTLNVSYVPFHISTSPNNSIFYLYIQKSGFPQTMTASTDSSSERNEFGESLLSEIEEYRQRSPLKHYSKSFIVLPWTLVLLLFLFLVFLSYQDTTGARHPYDGIFCEYSMIRVLSKSNFCSSCSACCAAQRYYLHWWIR